MPRRWTLTARRCGNANLGHGCLTILVSDCLAGFEVECESEGTFCFVLLPPYKSVAGFDASRCRIATKMHAPLSAATFVGRWQAWNIRVFTVFGVVQRGLR